MRLADHARCPRNLTESMRHASLLLLTVLCLGCASAPPTRDPTPDRPQVFQPLLGHPPPPTTRVEAVSEFPPDTFPDIGPSAASATESDARTRLAQAAALVDQTRVLVSGWHEADSMIAAARTALTAQDWSLALKLSGEASARADAALSDWYARRSNEELRKAYSYTGLDEGQLLQLRAAEETLVAGNGRLAYGRLRTLNEQLDRQIRTYTVRAGDSLWVIAGRPEVYANSWLWPLVWQANATQIPNPDRVRKGQVLKLRPHPSIEEIAQAVDYAKARVRRKTVTPRIGEIREASP